MRVIKALMALMLGLVVLIFAGVFIMPTERLATIAAQQVEQATGRSLQIGGAVRPSLYPVIGATVGEIRIGNPEWAGDGALLRAEELEVGLDLMALLRGEIVVERLVLQNPDLHLIRDAQGRTNWGGGADTQGEGVAAGNSAARGFSLARAQISGGTVRVEDVLAGVDLRISSLDLALDLPATGEAAVLEAEGEMNAQPFQITARTENAAGLISGAVAPVEIAATLAGASLAYQGLAGFEGLVLDGQLDATFPDPAALSQLMGADAGAVAPEYLPLSLAGRVSRSADGRLAARDAQFRAGGLRLTGAMDLVPGPERPRVTGTLAGDVLDLRRSSTPSQGGGPAGSGWSRNVIDASALGSLDADIAVTLGGLRTDTTTLGRTRLGIAIDRARAVMTFHEAALFGGQLTGEFVMNNRSGLSVGGDLRLRDIDLLPLLTDLADYRRLQGRADMDLQFLGVGNTMDAIMNSLRGDGRIDFAQGEIIGFDLAGMLRNLDMSYMGEGNRTIYQSVTGTFTISDGVLRNDDLRLDARTLSVTGRGQVGLGARNLDYRILPAAVRGDDVLRVPLMITGPWDAPRFRLDMEALAREQLRLDQERLEEIAREEAQRLEERTRSELDRRLERELGVQRGEGERIEDTLRRGLEQELGTRLRGILGGN